MFDDVLDAFGDIGGAVVDNFTSGSQLEQANIDRIKLNNQLAAANFQKENERKQKNQELIQNIVYIVLALIAISIGFSLFMNYKKNK